MPPLVLRASDSKDIRDYPLIPLSWSVRLWDRFIHTLDMNVVSAELKHISRSRFSVHSRSSPYFRTVKLASNQSSHLMHSKYFPNQLVHLRNTIIHIKNLSEVMFYHASLWSDSTLYILWIKSVSNSLRSFGFKTYIACPLQFPANKNHI